MIKKSTGILLLIIFSCAVVFGQSKGRLIGTVVDKKNGNPMPGANVVVKGTYYGAATDLDGNFNILKVSDGVYDIQVSMIGYKLHMLTGIEVTNGETINLDIELEETVLALGQEIVVIGGKSIIEVDETSSSIKYSKEDIVGKIAESVTDIIKNEVGVIEDDNNEIHVRGGRVDESQFIVDGLSLKDPLSGSVNSLYVNPNAIQELEFISGGFSAEYGQAMSGIIDVKLKEGSEQIEGSINYKTDQLNILGSSVNTDIVEFTLGGHESLLSRLIPGDIFYFISGYMNISDTYLPLGVNLIPKEDWQKNYAIRGDNSWSWMSKLTWKITPKHKFSISQNNSISIDQYFDNEYELILNNLPTITRGTYVTNFIWSQTISSQMFYEFNLGRYLNYSHKSVNGKHWTEYKETTDLEPIEYTKINEDGDIRIKQGDRYWDSGDDPHWYDYYGRNYSLNFELSYNTQNRHSLKIGLDAKATDMQVIDIYKPWIGTRGFGLSYDMYQVFPFNGSFFLQDRITFEGMIINIGMRYDYWFPGKYVEDAIDDENVYTITDAARKKFKAETFNLFGYRGKGHLSPRLGISHPVTDNDVLYFNYGHFSQLPTYAYVYAKLNSNSEATYNLIGNPNLNPKTTVSYELGIKHKFSKNSAVEFKAYYKDMFDYETAQSISAYNPKLGHYSFLMYINMDFARSRGIELIFRQRYGRFFSGNINASYSIVTGKASRPDANLLVEAGQMSLKPLSENFLPWDRPIQVSSNFRFKIDEDKPVYLFGLRMPNHCGANFHVEIQSGKRYTQSTITDTVFSGEDVYLIGPSQSDKPFSELADLYTRVDLKLYKDFKIGKYVTSRIFLQFENIFDVNIARFINPYTGEPYDPGQPIAYSYFDRPSPNYDPSRYYSPRKVMLGITWQF